LQETESNSVWVAKTVSGKVKTISSHKKGAPTNLSNQKVMVTGASGFIGYHLCQRLEACGAKVHAVSRRPPQSSQPEGLQWLAADVCSIDAVRDLFRSIRPDVIYHLASHVMGAPGLEHVLPTFYGNLQSSVNLLTAAAETGCRRLVLTGSLAEPDLSKGEEFPSAPYAAAKWASSAYGRMFHALYKVPVVLARVFMVYGPAQKDLSKLIPYATLSLLQKKSPKISSGDRLIDWIYVSDVVDGFIRLAEASNVEGSTIELGSGKLISIREIVGQLADVVDSGTAATFGALPDRPLEPVRIANIGRSFEQTGWKPMTPLAVGLKTTVDWYRKHMTELIANEIAVDLKISQPEAG
jgi:UDP-glucose 4-epimerase